MLEGEACGVVTAEPSDRPGEATEWRAAFTHSWYKLSATRSLSSCDSTDTLKNLTFNQMSYQTVGEYNQSTDVSRAQCVRQ